MSDRREEMRFLADRMLGRLCRLLRGAGVDCAWAGMAAPLEITRRAAFEDRILLTRDTRIIRQEIPLRRFFMDSDHVDEQAREFFAEFGTKFLDNAFTRCVECNVVLDRVERDSLPPVVPLYVRLTQERFSGCPSCGKVYWNATHKARMASRLHRIIADATGTFSTE